MEDDFQRQLDDALAARDEEHARDRDDLAAALEGRHAAALRAADDARETRKVRDLAARATVLTRALRLLPALAKKRVRLLALALRRLRRPRRVRAPLASAPPRDRGALLAKLWAHCQLIAAFRNWQCVWLLAPDDERRAPRPPPDWLPASFAAVH